jgi:predicted alpha-1,2-mannosidase
MRKLFILLVIVPGQLLVGQPDVTDYVDPMIGTDGSGHTFPGVVLPHGMVQLSPDTDVGGWKRCSGYHYSDSTIVGFSHTHISGTGVGDLGDVMIMPVTGRLYLQRGTDTTYRSGFVHEDEEASVGYYSVFLKDYGIKAELTATVRAGMHRYTFPQADSVYFVIDYTHRVKSWRGKTKWGFIKIPDDSTILGYRINEGWARTRTMYFAMRFSSPFQRGRDTKIDAHEELKYFVKYSTDKDEQILVKVAVSPVSMKNAMQNLEQEMPGWNFDEIVHAARKAWNKELSAIRIEADEKTKRIFYTSLYHAHIHPSVYMDVNGEYRGLDQEIHRARDYTNYTVFSLWDTYRAWHPLMTIIDTERTNSYIRSMLAHYQQSVYNMLPIWSLQAWETWCMIGYHSIPPIADAYLKGIRGYDARLALKAMVNTASSAFYQGLGDYMRLGYVPANHREPVSRTLEFAYDDWCIAQMAGALGEKAINADFSRRASFYQNVFDNSTGFMRAKDSLGVFTTRNPSGIFDPLYAHYGHDYTEGNAWQYSWYVPHDVSGLVALMGGNDAFEKKLDSLFLLEPEKNDDAPHDISGLIGQYAHGNEPSHHIAFLYNWVLKPWKTQEIVHRIMTEYYDDVPDGICGNEDCGQMSAWYLFNAMGFYPVNPANSVYVFGCPVVERAEICLENGKTFTVKVQNPGRAHKYIQTVILNGNEYKRTWISHRDIMAGGELVFVMGAHPATKPWEETDAIPPLKKY